MERDVLWCISPEEVESLRRACPDCVEMPDPDGEENLPRVLEEMRPRIVCPVWGDFSATYSKTCREAGVVVFVDERKPAPRWWKKALAWHADGIQTDDPAKLIEFLRQRAEK